VYETLNNVYFVLEMIECGELFKYSKRLKNNLSNIDIQTIMKNVLVAIKYIHSKNIIHRDIKP
jgi:calcium/calmodulin-dependent protein kinase I